MSLFRRYPFNNFLHHHVERMCRDAWRGQPSLLAHLFDRRRRLRTTGPSRRRARWRRRAGPRAPGTRDVPGWATLAGVAAATGSPAEDAEPLADADALETAPDEEREGRRRRYTHTRRGHRRGHRRCFVSSACRGEHLCAEKLESDPRWSAYLEGEFAARNAPRTRAWRCGRPAGMDDPDDDDDGDDGDFDLGGAGSRDDAYDRAAGGGWRRRTRRATTTTTSATRVPRRRRSFADEDETADEDGAEEDGELANAPGGAASIAAGLFKRRGGAFSVSHAQERVAVGPRGRRRRERRTHDGRAGVATAAEPFAGDAEEDDGRLAEEDEGDGLYDASSGRARPTPTRWARPSRRGAVLGSPSTPLVPTTRREAPVHDGDPRSVQRGSAVSLRAVLARNDAGRLSHPHGPHVNAPVERARRYLYDRPIDPIDRRGGARGDARCFAAPVGRESTVAGRAARLETTPSRPFITKLYIHRSRSRRAARRQSFHRNLPPPPPPHIAPLERAAPLEPRGEPTLQLTSQSRVRVPARRASSSQGRRRLRPPRRASALIFHDTR